MFGILSLIWMSYMVGIYFGFYCEPALIKVYALLVNLMIAILLVIPVVPSLRENSLIVYPSFISVGVFCVVPIAHWINLAGGFSAEPVRLFLGRLVAMLSCYALGAIFLVSSLPERLFPGQITVWGASHQIWHLLVVLGCLIYLDGLNLYTAYLFNHPCTQLHPNGNL